MSLVVVGTMAYDAIETPFGQTDKVIGGAATYIALSAAYFTKPTYNVSIVGGDFDKDFMKQMEQRGVDMTGVEVVEDKPSMFWKGKYHADMNARDTLVTDLNVLLDFNPKVPQAARNAEYLMLGNLDPKLQRNVIEQMSPKPKLILMDTMNFWLDSQREEVLKTIKMVDVLTINDEEARMLAGEPSLRKAARIILDMGPRYLVIKKGEHGALLFHQDQVFFAPALPLEEVYDPTGAGDTFAGGFIGYLARSGDISFGNMKMAVLYGSTMASFCVEKFGPERMMNLTQTEIQKRRQAFLELMAVDISLVSPEA